MSVINYGDIGLDAREFKIAGTTVIDNGGANISSITSAGTVSITSGGNGQSIILNGGANNIYPVRIVDPANIDNQLTLNYDATTNRGVILAATQGIQFRPLSLPNEVFIPNSHTYTSASNQLKFFAGETGSSTIINVNQPAADSIYTLPDVGTSASFVMNAGAQTIAGIKTFTDDTIMDDVSVNNLTIPTTSATAGQIIQNGNRLLHTFNTNLHLGESSGNFTQTSSANIGIGNSTLSSLTTGGSNVAVGLSALEDVTTGQQNTAVGGNALTLNTGNDNCAVGYNSLANNTTGINNTAIGTSAGSALTTGNNNICIGRLVNGVAGESDTIRIGNGTTSCIVSGIRADLAADASDVLLVNASNRIGNAADTINFGESGGTININSSTTFADDATFNTLINIPTSSDTAGQIVQNGNRLLHTTGTTSLFLGASSGNFTSTGSNNIGIGPDSVQSTTTGGNNIGVGKFALQSVTTGSLNTAIGNDTLKNVISGNFNVGIGDQVLIDNTASDNTSVGHASMTANTSGSANTAVGESCLSSNTTGSNNTAVGELALSSNVSGVNNTAFGNSALLSNTANANTAFGTNALASNTVCIQNTAIGFNALTTNDGDVNRGFSNTAVGFESMFSALGVSAGQASDNTAVGTYSLRELTTGSFNTALGNDSLRNLTTGGGNVAVGHNSGLSVSTGSSNVFVGTNAGFNTTTGTNNIYIGESIAPANESNHIRIGNTSSNMVIEVSDLYRRIGTDNHHLYDSRLLQVPIPIDISFNFATTGTPTFIGGINVSQDINIGYRGIILRWTYLATSAGNYQIDIADSSGTTVHTITKTSAIGLFQESETVLAGTYTIPAQQEFLHLYGSGTGVTGSLLIYTMSIEFLRN